jgi:lipoprotein-releasing system permease protein
MLLLQKAPDIIVQRTMAGRHELIPTAYAKKIKEIRGVGNVSPRYWGYYYDALVEANYTLMGAGSGSDTLELLNGRLPDKDSECALGAGVANLRGSGHSGELILVNSSNTGVLFNVTGIFQSESNLLTNDLIILTDNGLVEFFGFPPEQATDIAVEVRNKSEVVTVASKIKQMLPDSRPISKRELVRTYDMVFNWRSGMMLTVFSAAIIAFCIMAWDKATGISAEEKQEIGILKAVGWETSDVLVLKCWEGLIISLSSFLLGITLAFIHIFFFDAFILAAVIKGWSVLFPVFDLRPHLNLFHVFIMGFLTIAPYMACTVLPTWKAAITDPETVMRG